MARLLLIIVVFCFSLLTKSDQNVLLNHTLEKYTGPSMVEMDVEKEIKLSVIGRTKIHKGHIYLARGKVRIEFEKPNKSLVVLDGKHTWVVTYPPEEFGGPVQVARSKAEQGKNIISLVSEGRFLEFFEVVGKTKEKGSVVFEFKPKADIDEFKKVFVFVNPTKKVFELIKYKDQLENEIKYVFTNTAFQKKIKKKLFVYVPPKDAEVMHLE